MLPGSITCFSQQSNSATRSLTLCLCLSWSWLFSALNVFLILILPPSLSPSSTLSLFFSHWSVNRPSLFLSLSSLCLFLSLTSLKQWKLKPSTCCLFPLSCLPPTRHLQNLMLLALPPPSPQKSPRTSSTLPCCPPPPHRFLAFHNDCSLQLWSAAPDGSCFLHSCSAQPCRYSLLYLPHRVTYLGTHGLAFLKKPEQNTVLNHSSAKQICAPLTSTFRKIAPLLLANSNKEMPKAIPSLKRRDYAAQPL